MMLKRGRAIILLLELIETQYIMFHSQYIIYSSTYILSIYNTISSISIYLSISIFLMSYTHICTKYEFNCLNLHRWCNFLLNSKIMWKQGDIWLLINAVRFEIIAYIALHFCMKHLVLHWRVVNFDRRKFRSGLFISEHLLYLSR